MKLLTLFRCSPHWFNVVQTEIFEHQPQFWVSDKDKQWPQSSPPTSRQKTETFFDIMDDDGDICTPAVQVHTSLNVGYFFQILWKSRSNILVTYPSHLKKLRSILRSWLEKMNSGFFTIKDFFLQINEK